MGYLDNINDYSEKYSAYGQKIIKESAETLKKSGIYIPIVSDKQEDNIDSCVIKKPHEETKKLEKPKKTKHKVKRNNEADWIRDAMPTYNNPLSISSSIMNDCKTSLGKATNQENKGQTDIPTDGNTEDDETETVDSYTIETKETNTECIDTLSNSNDDQGSGNPLKTLLEKDSAPEGYYSDNFAGANHEIDKQNKSSEQDVLVYSDNFFSKNNTTVIFGGSANTKINRSPGSTSKQFNYNVYAYGKQKFKEYTFGLGAMDTRKNDVHDIDISLGAKHNKTKLYGTLNKKITIIPGTKTLTDTDVNIGIGDESGYLDPKNYKRQKSNIEETLDNDKIGSLDPLPAGEDVEIDTTSDKPKNTVVKLIISDTNNNKEYGIYGGYIFRKVTPKQNYAFIMPYAQISDLNIDSNEGVKFMLGLNTGNHVNYANGWEISTKGMIEVSREAISGSGPSDYLLSNINFKANKNNFSSEIGIGALVNNQKTDCKYIEAKVKYKFNDRLNAGLKVAAADYKFDKERQRVYQIAAGVNYSF